ncbi:unnamed protein product [Brachionus calyciflorus]|uniref:Uncharacterized protein n=1 Tax=Brachionus calyciflorus TaxID=104777 RepID=A0A814A7N0_9BILA|nr:unnamed protein product [Brachionus calyciflorus]
MKKKEELYELLDQTVHNVPQKSNTNILVLARGRGRGRGRDRGRGRGVVIEANEVSGEVSESVRGHCNTVTEYNSRLNGSPAPEINDLTREKNKVLKENLERLEKNVARVLINFTN